MGNCSLKGVVGKTNDPIRIMTDSGGVFEYKAPTLVENVVRDYPGCGVYRKGHMSSPLLHHEQLFNGQSYYVLPLKEESLVSPRLSSGRKSDIVRRKLSEPAVEVLPSSGNGVWKVKLVIDTKQLEEILSEQVNIEALIEKMRTMANAESSTPRRSKMYAPWISSVLRRSSDFK